ncbi:MAG: hypothetical protein HC856_08230 [Pseudanabaena sp. RU_4_16]|nr:hypothetical protein [Pseudanabaena sp. RU_4_16]
MSNKQKRFPLSGWHYVVLGTSSLFLLASCGSNLTRAINPSPSPTTAASSSPTTTVSPSPTTAASPSPTSTARSDNAPIRVKQARARNYTGILNRVSQAYFVENERFTGDIDQVLKGFRSKPNSPNYDFSLALIDEKKAVQTIVVAKLEGLKSYTGLAYVTSLKSNSADTKAIICESDRPTQDKPAAPELVNDEAKCPSGYTQINSRRY